MTSTARPPRVSSAAERYARHALIPGWEQARLADAGVVMVGLGALGNETARLLALSGVGWLILCDPDRVEASNLSRCGLFRASDLGRPKVEAAADADADALHALAWAPVQQRVECPRCGFAEARWGLPARAVCPGCAAPLRPRTTLDLAEAPDELTLAALGIAPGEILAVRTRQGIGWAELSVPRSAGPPAPPALGRGD